MSNKSTNDCWNKDCPHFYTCNTSFNNLECVCDILKFKLKCEECMSKSPYSYCCKVECGEHEFCKGCEYYV